MTIFQYQHLNHHHHHHQDRIPSFIIFLDCFIRCAVNTPEDILTDFICDIWLCQFCYYSNVRMIWHWCLWLDDIPNALLTQIWLSIRFKISFYTPTHIIHSQLARLKVKPYEKETRFLLEEKPWLLPNAESERQIFSYMLSSTVLVCLVSLLKRTLFLQTEHHRSDNK